MFESVQPAPPDAILGLTEAFKQDPNPEKINLGVGIYKDEHGQTPVPPSVKEAERRLLDTEASKTYLPIDGAPAFQQAVQALLFGGDHAVLSQQRAATCHTPGGTGALRVAGDYLHRIHPDASIWLSEPTWPNHPQVFDAAGVPTKSYPYFDGRTNGLAFEDMGAALESVPEGDVVLLHACCHNPTGVDPTATQWARIGDILAQRGAVPLVDFAYQGFANGLEEDAQGLRALAERVPELLVANSFSKNFGLYNDRVGALTVVGRDAEHAQAVMSHVKKCVRANYSNPPAHGGAIVATILEDPDLRAQWQDELKQMRDRINGMRHLFVDTLKKHGAQADFSFIAQQAGMFSFSGLTADQVETLRREHSIYIVGSGRINVAGMSEQNMDRLCKAIVSVL